MVIHGGGPLSGCSIGCIDCDRYVRPITYLRLINSFMQPIRLFIAATNELFDPITVICHNGQIEKRIHWSAFQLKEVDWERIVDVKTILAIC
jgi:hypothetical protein